MKWNRDWNINRSRKVFAVSLVMACMLTLTIGAAVQAADHRSWLAAAVEGDVHHSSPFSTAWQYIAVGDRLDPGSRVRTGTDGRLTIIRGRDTVVVDPNSEVIVSGDPDNPPNRIIQSLGWLLFDMETRESRSFSVETPLLVATIKGTRFVVFVSSGETTVTVEEGTVEVTRPATGENVLLEPGMTARVSAEDGELEVTALEVPATDAVAGTVDAAAGAVDAAAGAVDSAPDAVGGAAKSARDTVGGTARSARDAVGGAVEGAGGLVK